MIADLETVRAEGTHTKMLFIAYAGCVVPEGVMGLVSAFDETFLAGFKPHFPLPIFNCYEATLSSSDLCGLNETLGRASMTGMFQREGVGRGERSCGKD